MQTFIDVIDKWPSIQALAEDIDLPYPTVASWRWRGSIPSRHWPAVRRAAKARNIDGLSAELFEEIAERAHKQKEPECAK